MAGSCKLGNEPSGFIKFEEYLKQLRTWSVSQKKLCDMHLVGWLVGCLVGWLVGCWLVTYLDVRQATRRYYMGFFRAQVKDCVLKHMCTLLLYNVIYWRCKLNTVYSQSSEVTVESNVHG